MARRRQITYGEAVSQIRENHPLLMKVILVLFALLIAYHAVITPIGNHFQNLSRTSSPQSPPIYSKAIGPQDGTLNSLSLKDDASIVSSAKAFDN